MISCIYHKCINLIYNIHHHTNCITILYIHLSTLFIYLFKNLKSFGNINNIKYYLPVLVYLYLQNYIQILNKLINLGITLICYLFSFNLSNNTYLPIFLSNKDKYYAKDITCIIQNLGLYYIIHFHKVHNQNPFH